MNRHMERFSERLCERRVKALHERLRSGEITSDEYVDQAFKVFDVAPGFDDFLCSTTRKYARVLRALAKV